MRIIAGRYRGRKLKAPPGLATRPTLDRAREAIFMILGDLTGLSVLDLYAGTGAMGLEALSRGAERAVFVESDRVAARFIRSNIEALGAEKQAVLLEMPVERTLERLQKLGPFDLVLADPPWPIAAEAALEVARLVGSAVREDARILLGHPSDKPIEVPESSGLTLVDRRKWGGSGMSFYEIAAKA